VWVHLLPSLLCCGLRLIVDLVVWFVMRERLRAVWSSPGLDPATASILPAAASGIPPRVAP
jgi:hypothetical protein